jgi:O-antigen/teichoic acid export membrane protein
LTSNKINFVFYTLGIAISGILSFIFIPVVVQMCGKEIYATYSMILNTLSIICMFCYAWVGQSYIRFYTKKKTQLDSVSNNLLSKSLILGSCFFVPLSLVITPVSFSELVLFIPTFFLFGYYCYYVLVFQAKQKASLIMICEVLRTSLNIIVAIILLKAFGANHSITTLAISLLSSYAIPLTILHFKNREEKKDLNPQETKAITKQIMSFGIPIAIFLSGSLALSVNDRFIISKLVNKESAGIYAAIYDTINKGVIAIFSPILMTFYPVVTQLYNNNEKKLALKKIKKLIWIEVLLISLGLIVLVLICPYLIELIFKQKADTNLQWTTFLVFFGVCLWQIAMLVHKPLELQQKTKLMAVAVIIALVVNVGLNYFLITKKSSLVIPAITTIIGSLVYIGIVVSFSIKKNKS